MTLPVADPADPAGPIRSALQRLGLLGPGAAVPMQPLTGGVSSDIWRVDLPSGPVCVKRALARLKVAQVWEAPVARNRYEQAYLRTAAAIVPGAVPRLLADDAGRTYLHRGIAGRGFERRFELADTVRVDGARIENGLLHIDLVREVPERLRPRRIEIAGASGQPAEAAAPTGTVVQGLAWDCADADCSSGTQREVSGSGNATGDFTELAIRPDGLACFEHGVGRIKSAA